MQTPASTPTFRDYSSFLVRYLRPRMHLVLLLAATLFTSIALQLINPQILRAFIDAATKGAERIANVVNVRSH